MHLLLREHGWVPERDDFVTAWNWSRAGCACLVTTWRTYQKTHWMVECSEQDHDSEILHQGTSVLGLKKRLKELDRRWPG